MCDEIGVSRRKLDRNRKIPTSRSRRPISNGPEEGDNPAIAIIPSKVEDESQLLQPQHLKRSGSEFATLDLRAMMRLNTIPSATLPRPVAVTDLEDKLMQKNPSNWSNSDMKVYFTTKGFSSEVVQKVVGSHKGADVMKIARDEIAIRTSVKTALEFSKHLKELRNLAREFELKEKEKENACIIKTKAEGKEFYREQPKVLNHNMKSRRSEPRPRSQERSELSNFKSLCRIQKADFVKKKQYICCYCQIPGHTIRSCMKRKTQNGRTFERRLLDYSYVDMDTDALTKEPEKSSPKKDEGLNQLIDNSNQPRPCHSPIAYPTTPLQFRFKYSIKDEEFSDFKLPDPPITCPKTQTPPPQSNWFVDSPKRELLPLTPSPPPSFPKLISNNYSHLHDHTYYNSTQRQF